MFLELTFNNTAPPPVTLPQLLHINYNLMTIFDATKPQVRTPRAGIGYSIGDSDCITNRHRRNRA